VTIEQQIESDVLVRLGSQLNSEAVSAAAELRDQGALHDGALRGVRLIGANLQGADLSGADLREARLEWADLRNADLRGADLTDARLEVASLQRAQLGEAALAGAVLLKAQLQGAQLAGADLRRAALGEANFQGADLKRAQLQQARLSLADLQGADLEGANLEGADLLGARLQEANLVRANLQGAYLGEANLRRALAQNSDLRHATLAGAKLRLVELGGAQLQGARLGLADLQWADLSRADLTRAHLLRVKLQAASLRATRLQDANLTGADLAQADLSGADLRGALLAECTFDSATTLPDGTGWTPDADLRRFTDPGHPDYWDPQLTVPGPPAGLAATVAAPEMARPSVAPVFPEPAVEKKTAARKQIRGSSLLLSGRLISMVVNFLVQVLTVRYLSKTDYGAFAYALSMVSLGETFITLGLDRAVTRFIPIYQEKKEYNKLFGTLALVLGTILSLGLALILLVIGLRGAITGTLIDDREAVALLAILIALSPVQALDNVINGLFAVFSSPKAIFFRKYVLAPALRLTVVVLLIAAKADVKFLAVGYLMAGALGVGIFSYILVRVMREQDLFAHLNLREVRIPAREVLSFTVPLLASDLVYVVMNTIDAVLLEQFHGTADVAAFRAVQPTAKMNQMVLASFALLFTPAAARLFARGDRHGINQLYWENAAWVAVVSFPIFALTFSLAGPVTVALFETRYEESAVIMAMLSFGYFFNAATGQNGLTLKVLGKLRYIVAVDIIAAGLNLALNLLLIPRYGALGAAVGTMVTLIIFNLMKQAGLMLGTGISLFDRHYVQVYAVLIAATVGLLAFQVLLEPPVWIGVVAVALISLLVLRFSRHALNVEHTFPELFRIPVLRWLLSG
jgi:uncharacterized protein YjbI with pentapeptide repeats/O-antigen/teichoic acid export membrane protein